MVGQFEHLRQVVPHHHHGLAAVGHILDQVQEGRRLPRSKRGCRLVEQQHPRLEVERSGDGDSLALAAAQLPDTCP